MAGQGQGQGGFTYVLTATRGGETRACVTNLPVEERSRAGERGGDGDDGGGAA